MLCCRFSWPIGSIDYQDTALCSGLNINAINPNPRASHNVQLRANAIHYLAGYKSCASYKNDIGIRGFCIPIVQFTNLTDKNSRYAFKYRQRLGKELTTSPYNCTRHVYSFSSWWFHLTDFACQCAANTRTSTQH